VQFMGLVLVDMCDDSAQPFLVRSMARGHPFSDAVSSVQLLGQLRMRMLTDATLGYRDLACRPWYL
jgi:hypothetical protein